MKRKAYHILLVQVACLLLASCIDDKGNYDYIDEETLFPVHISGIEQEYSVTQGAELNIAPVLTGIDDASRYTYSWFVTSNTSSSNYVAKRFDIADTKDLNYAVKLDVGDWRLYFEVIDAKRDIYRIYQAKLTVTASPIDKGWFVLKENAEGKTDFDYVDLNGKLYADCLDAGGNALEGKPVSMFYQSFGYTYQSYDDSGNAVLQKEQMAYHVLSSKDFRTFNARTMQQFYGFDEIFYQKPDTWNPQDLCLCQYAVAFLLNDYKAYAFATGFTSNIGRYGAAKVGTYKLFPRLLPTIYQTAYVYDLLSKEFYSMGSTNAQALINLNRLSATRIPQSDEIIDLLPEKGGFFNIAAMAVTRNTDNQYMLSQLSFMNATYSVLSYLPVADNTQLATELRKGTPVMCAPENGNFIYFSSGNKVYGYVNAEGLDNKERLVVTLPAGETVMALKNITTSEGNSLAVLTAAGGSWTLRLYKVLGLGNPEVEDSPMHTYQGSGTGQFLMYRES